jgi:hypothetical protein
VVEESTTLKGRLDQGGCGVGHGRKVVVTGTLCAEAMIWHSYCQ